MEKTEEEENGKGGNRCEEECFVGDDKPFSVVENVDVDVCDKS